MAIKRPNGIDPATQAADELSDFLTAVAGSIKGENPVGFGKQRLTAKEYKKRLMGMSREERLAEINERGIDTVTEALRFG